jgi:membrane protease YdiL (CAAX protease family)
MSIPAYVLAASASEEVVMLLALALAPAPILAASILAYRADGSAGVKRLLKRAFDFRRIQRKRWYLPILLLMPALFLLALALMVWLGEPVPEGLLPLVAAPLALLLFFPFALFEEVGWMGYAFDPMQGRWSALGASLLLGALWAVWHIPFYVFAGLEPAWIAGQLVALVAVRTIIAWIYNNAGRSVFAAILSHAVYNACTMIIPSYYSALGHALTSTLIVVTAVAVAVLWGPQTLAWFRFGKGQQAE